MPLLRASLATALLCAMPGLASAHGAAPVALDVQFVEVNGKREPVVETNYGLVKRDANGAWRLLCSEVLASGGKWFSVGESGSIGMGSTEGFARSSDGCGFTPASGVSASIASVLRVPRNGAPDAVFLVLEGVGGAENLLRSVDDGATFSPLAVPGESRVNAIRADPHVPGHLVATGLATDGFLLFESQDLGDHWTSTLLPGDGTVRILAVTGSGLFFRRVVDGKSTLLRSTDGATVEVVLEPDTQPAFVAETAPGELWVSGWKEVWRSLDGGVTWTRTSEAGDLLCLERDGDTLYACMEDDGSRVAVRTSKDGGKTWDVLLRFDEIAGVVACPADSDVGSACDSVWLVDALTFGAKLNPDPPKTDPPPATGCQCGSGAGAFALLGFIRRRRGP